MLNVLLTIMKSIETIKKLGFSPPRFSKLGIAELLIDAGLDVYMLNDVIHEDGNCNLLYL